MVGSHHTTGAFIYSLPIVGRRALETLVHEEKNHSLVSRGAQPLFYTALIWLSWSSVRF